MYTYFHLSLDTFLKIISAERKRTLLSLVGDVDKAKILTINVELICIVTMIYIMLACENSSWFDLNLLKRRSFWLRKALYDYYCFCAFLTF